MTILPSETTCRNPFVSRDTSSSVIKERSPFHRQAILINGLQEALAQFAMNFHRRANHGMGLRILFHKICGNRRKSAVDSIAMHRECLSEEF